MPGQFIPGADSHSRAYGAYGAVGIGVGSTTLGFGWSTGYIYFTLAEGAARRLRRQAAAVGQRQGHRPRAAAALGREAVAGHVGGAGRREPAAADRLSQHDREHDGRGRSAERHLRARRHHVCVVSRRRASPSCRIRRSRRAPTRVYEIDETIDLAGVTPMIAKPFSPGNAFPAEEVARERLTFDKAMIGSCTNGSYDDLLTAALVIRAAREQGAAQARDRVRRSFPGSGGVGRQIERPDPRLGGESIARGVPIGRRRDPPVVVRPLLRPGPGRARARASARSRRSTATGRTAWASAAKAISPARPSSPPRRWSATWRRPSELGLKWNPEEFGCLSCWLRLTTSESQRAVAAEHRRARRAAAHLSLLRSDEAEVLRQGARPRGVGLPEAAAEGARAVRAGRHPAHQGQLPAHLRRRSDRRRLSRGRLVRRSAIRRCSNGSSRSI